MPCSNTLNHSNNLGHYSSVSVHTTCVWNCQKVILDWSFLTYMENQKWWGVAHSQRLKGLGVQKLSSFASRCNKLWDAVHTPELLVEWDWMGSFAGVHLIWPLSLSFSTSFLALLLNSPGSTFSVNHFTQICFSVRTKAQTQHTFHGIHWVWLQPKQHHHLTFVRCMFSVTG